ncbi:GCN5 family acetyltransferase [candidate division WOR_3 bacterium SM23_60]|uniref:GCN5 family acetyltransferase n=1 Tax=candidate division WOR_3 bacterium SM23_60 TaxID=1703780 RepID=A0A0S8G8A2_UNCW3|nr:MAG: GCN5 family acetyltransferase [candidate division WOR_3 bacterium SM23_60]
MTIRPATIDDLPAITEIYNDAIRKTVATFDTEPKSSEEQKMWFEAHGTRNPIIVADADGAVVGWASLSQYSNRCAYSETAEVSVYVAEPHRGKGIGRKLLQELIESANKAALHVLIARIAGGNEISIQLFESQGFAHVGVLKEVGRKFGRLVDVYIMQKLFE